MTEQKTDEATTVVPDHTDLPPVPEAATAQPADARRGGSFGSRGARTYSAPAPTRTAPASTS